MCSKKTRRMVEKTFTCEIGKCSGKLSKPSWGLVPGCSMGKAKPPDVVEAQNSLVKTAPWFQRSHFQVLQGVSPNACAIRDLPGLCP